MSSRRMNLFRQIQRPEKKKIPTVPLSQLTSSFHVMVGGVMLFFSLVGMIGSFVSYRRNVASTNRRIAEAKKAMADVVAQADAMREQRAREEAARAKASRAPASAETVNTLDGTWTALVWKLAAYSGADIQFGRVVLGSSAGTPGGGTNKEVMIEGAAQSVPAMRDWLTALLHNVPGYDFVMDYQASSGGSGGYPVSFHITARVQ